MRDTTGYEGIYMYKTGRKGFFRTAWLTALVAGLSGCATTNDGRAVKPGDRVDVRFTCRLADGAIASSTEKTVADDTGVRKAPIFLASSTHEPVTLPSGDELDRLRKKPLRAMEEEIMSRLTDAVVGMRAGESRSLKIAAGPASATDGEPATVRMARVRVRPKELRMTVDEYRKRKGKEPALGAGYTLDPSFPGRVTKIEDGGVVITFAPAGNTVRTPFGIGTVREMDDRYEVDLDVRKGRLVRSGPLVGRITEVDDRSFTVDYAHPFGGEELDCEVRVASVEPRDTAATARKSVQADAGAAVGGLPAREAEALLGTVSDAINEAKQQGRESTEVTIGAASGDLVTVNYTASLEDGAVFATSNERIGKDPAVKKASWYQPPEVYRPEEVVAGKGEILPGLGEAVIGMRPGEKKRLTLAPDKAFGPVDPKNTVRFPVARSMPRVIRMPAAEYAQRFSSFPVVGKEVDLVPYFRSRVARVTEQDVALEFLAENGKVYTEPYGAVTVAVAGDMVTTTLKPVIGAPFPLNGRTGVVTAAEGTSFTVDFNNPLAGKTIVLDVEAVSLTRGLSLAAKPPAWLEAHDAGLAEAKKLGKPTVLVLYADWCEFCKRLFAETMEDPRVKNLRDRLVWVKVNSDKETAIKQRYAQEGYPLVVLLRPDGSVAEKIDGFRDGAAFSRLLKDFLATWGKVAAGTK
jgi:FKBP-type peptidyl-prolyl cis-trans isomerase 2